MSLHSAASLARSLAGTPCVCTDPDSRDRPRRLAVGDPQAPLETFLALLDGRGLIEPDGRLSPDVLLVSVGDHFDWGLPADQARASADGLALLAWLAAHPPDQVVILAGNHDLGRVGELADLDAATWEAARAEAVAVYYRPGPLDREAEAAFLARYPMFPTSEVAARDFSAFSVAQRALVERMLRVGRFKLAYDAAPDLLLVHAGVTHGELEGLGLPPSERGHAAAVARALNDALAGAVARWRGGPLAIPHLHQPGDAARGEAGGALFHRPADPAHSPPDEFSGPGRRRYDPRAIPRGLTQAIGHVRDKKCRELMPAWADDAAPRDGVLRHLHTDGRRVAYAHGLARAAEGEAALWFLDAGMQHVPPGQVPLLDLRARRAA